MTSIAVDMNDISRKFLAELIYEARSSRGENLLHYTSRHNRPQSIVPIIVTCGVSLCEQDSRGRTPVHTAIDMGHQECIAEFQKLFHSYSSLPERTQKELCHIFQCYNHKGYTILHETVLKDMREFTRTLLQFCQKQAVDVTNYEVLGCGDTILHLAVRENLLDMATIICECMPELLKLPNYTGTLPRELYCVTTEMQMVLDLRISKRNEK